jgi:hypothetical protein
MWAVALVASAGVGFNFRALKLAARSRRDCQASGAVVDGAAGNRQATPRARQLGIGSGWRWPVWWRSARGMCLLSRLGLRIVLTPLTRRW